MGSGRGRWPDVGIESMGIDIDQEKLDEAVDIHDGEARRVVLPGRHGDVRPEARRGIRCDILVLGDLLDKLEEDAGELAQPAEARRQALLHHRRDRVLRNPSTVEQRRRCGMEPGR